MQGELRPLVGGLISDEKPLSTSQVSLSELDHSDSFVLTRVLILFSLQGCVLSSEEPEDGISSFRLSPCWIIWRLMKGFLFFFLAFRRLDGFVNTEQRVEDSVLKPHVV